MPCQRAEVLNTEYWFYNGLHYNSGIAEIAGFGEIVPTIFIICNHRTWCDELILEVRTKTYMLYGSETAFAEAVVLKTKNELILNRTCTPKQLRQF